MIEVCMLHPFCVEDEASVTSEYFRKMTEKCHFRDLLFFNQAFFGRPVFSCGRPASTFFSVARSICEISATPIRSNSLFLTSKPAFRAAFFTWPSTAYSASGMVKLSRTSFSLWALTLASGAVAGLAAAFGAAFGTALGAGLAAAFGAGLAAAFGAAFGAGLTAAFTAAVGAAGLAAGLAAA